MTTKQCFKCLCQKPLEAFYKHAAMGDGHLGKCKECTKSDASKHRQKNLEKIRAYDSRRASQPHRMVLRARVIGEYRTNFPNRVKANAAVKRAVQAGQIQRLPCLVCGANAVGHHPDYDRPLDVVWLCQPHHKQAHALVQRRDP